jgi:hypothetical protein
MGRLWLTLMTGALLGASPVQAEQRNTPRFEIGVTVSGILPLPPLEGPVVVVAAGPGFVVNLTRRLGVGVLAEVFGPGGSGYTSAVYETTVRIALRETPHRSPALSINVGAAGFAFYHRGPERRVERPDRSIVVYPAYRTLDVLRPNMLTAGVVRDQLVGSHLSTSLGVQGYLGEGGVAMRISVGLSFVAGGRR